MFLDLIERRRSIRKYANRPVEKEKTDQLLEAALRAPSSMGSSPWDFVVVTRSDLMEGLSRAKAYGSAFLKGAPLGIVVCGDPNRSQVWVEDCAIASIYIHLAASDLGLGSCWVQIRKRMHDEGTTAEAYISRLLQLPESLKVLSVVGIGYPAEKKPAHPKDTLLYNRIHGDRYGGPMEADP